jgi:hypothetical protein
MCSALQPEKGAAYPPSEPVPEVVTVADRRPCASCYETSKEPYRPCSFNWVEAKPCAECQEHSEYAPANEPQCDFEAVWLRINEDDWLGVFHVTPNV